MGSLKSVYMQWDSLCRAYPRTATTVVATFATGAFVFVSLKQTVIPGWITVWITVALLIPIPFHVWAKVRRERRLRTEWEAEESP